MSTPETPRMTDRISLCGYLIKAICEAGNHAFLPASVLLPLNALTESYEAALAASQQEVERHIEWKIAKTHETAELIAALAAAREDSAKLRDVLDCGTNALRDSICASGNRAQTNLHWIGKMRRDSGLDTPSPPPETTQGEHNESR